MALSREEIESSGWKHIGGDWYSLKEVPGQLPYFLHVRLRKWKGDELFIDAFRSDPSIYPDQEEEKGRLFDGVIKNVDELLLLMKMIRCQ
jgi:hypothetical protein